MRAMSPQIVMAVSRRMLFDQANRSVYRQMGLGEYAEYVLQRRTGAGASDTYIETKWFHDFFEMKKQNLKDAMQELERVEQDSEETYHWNWNMERH